MKIELRTNCVWLRKVYANSVGNSIILDDALPAHALLQAHKEWWEMPDEIFDETSDEFAVRWIETRAAELLASYLDEGT